MQPTTLAHCWCRAYRSHSVAAAIFAAVSILLVGCNSQKAPVYPAAAVGTSYEEIDTAISETNLPVEWDGVGMAAFAQEIADWPMPEVEPAAGPRRKDISLEINAALAEATPPQESSGYLLFRTEDGILFLRGELPDAQTSARLVAHLQNYYKGWHIDNRVRVDARLSWPEQGTLLTLRSLPAAQTLASDEFMAYAVFGRPWVHCCLDQGKLEQDEIERLGLAENERARLDLLLLLAPVTASNER